MRHLPFFLLLFCLLPVAPGHSASWMEKKFDLACSVGFVPNADIEGSFESDFPADESFDFKADPIPLVRLIADVHVLPNLSLGVNLNYAAIHLQEELDLGTWDGRNHRVPQDLAMLEFNAAVKGRFLVNPKVILKPGIAVGLRTTFSDSEDGRQKGVALNGGVEVQYLLETMYVFADLGFLSQPYGGVQDVGYIRAGPTLYLCLGAGI